MFLRVKITALVAMSLLGAVSAHAALDPISISSDENLHKPKWLYGPDKPPANYGKDTVTVLALVKSAQLAGQYSTCVDRAKAARKKAKSLDAWLAQVEVDCAVENLRQTGSFRNAETLRETLALIQKNYEWMVIGPQASHLRSSVAKAYVSLLEQDSKTDRSHAWNVVDRAEELTPFMDEKTKAHLWRLAGELAFIQQKPEAARDFLVRSLAEVESPETRGRLSIVETALNVTGNSTKKPAKNAKDSQTVEGSKSSDAVAGSVNNADLEATREELDLVDRVTTSLKTGDFSSAMEDAMKLIHDFPGGTRAKWATDRAIEVYSNLLEKSDPKLAPLREQLAKLLEKADSERLAEWARQLYNRGFYAEASRLARVALVGFDGARRTHVLDLAVDAAIASEDFSIAHALCKELIEKHAGTPSSRKALMYSGLTSYHAGNYAEAVASFERLIALPQTENLEVSARYWLWRSLQKSKAEGADAAADELMLKFPFSYYGLRARIERGHGALEWKPEVQEVQSTFWASGPERLAWEKAQILVKAGWLEEAQAELKDLPPPLHADDKAVRAVIWAAAGGYLQSSRWANEAWDEKTDLRRPPFTDAAFPREFSQYITLNAEARKLDSDLVRGLIKQESSYNTKATSSSNALGLMQLIPPTAREVAEELKMGNLDLPNDMFDPKRNITMGVFYLSKMLEKYQGSVPLALASYNAGPKRIDRWLAVRPSLKDLPTMRSSAPDDEIWFDEIPYAETSFYVKSILRNLLLYKMLDQGRVEVGNPLWAMNSSSSLPAQTPGK